MPTKWSFFTWSNGRRGVALVERKLDRVFYNQNLLNVCTSSNIITLPKLRSDHFPIHVDACFSFVRHGSRLIFMTMWTLHDKCREFIVDVSSQPVVGCPMFILSQKLHNIKNQLKSWNKEVLGIFARQFNMQLSTSITFRSKFKI